MVALNVQYFGSGFISANIGVDFVWNMFFIGLAEALSNLISSKICPYMPRRISLCYTCVIVSVVLSIDLLYGIPKWCMEPHELCWEKVSQTAIIVLYRFFISFGFSLTMIWANELYPTQVRSLGVGFSQAFALFGSFLSPYFLPFLTKNGGG